MKSEKKTQKPLWKTVLIFIAIIIFSLAVGWFFGAGAVTARNLLSGDSAAAALQNLALAASPIAYALLWVVGIMLCAVYFVRAKKLYAAWDGEDEKQAAQTEKLLSKYILVTNSLFILSIMLFTVWFYGCMGSEEPGGITFPAGFLAGIIAVMLMQRAAVEFVKRLNPEKRGEVLELGFQKTWEASMDEGEKLMMYKAGYKAFKTVNYLCIGVWLVSLLCQIVFSAGIGAGLAALVIWLVSMLTYQTEAIRLEYGKD